MLIHFGNNLIWRMKQPCTPLLRFSGSNMLLKCFIALWISFFFWETWFFSLRCLQWCDIFKRMKQAMKSSYQSSRSSYPVKQMWRLSKVHSWDFVLYIRRKTELPLTPVIFASVAVVQRTRLVLKVMPTLPRMDRNMLQSMFKPINDVTIELR